MGTITGKALLALGPDPMVSLEEFEEMWKIWPVGNKEDAYIQVAYAAAKKLMLNGERVTYAIMLEKYRDYVKMSMKRSPDPKFVAKIASWVQKGRYNENYEPPENPLINRFVK